MTGPVQPLAVAAGLADLWSPRVVAEVEDSYVKVARVHGVFGWHAHADEDELFYVLQGRLRIEFEDGAVTLDAGQLYVVPKGRRHNPVAEDECLILLLERRSTRHTGDGSNEWTRSVEQQLQGYATPPRA